MTATNPHDAQRWVAFRNCTTETVPAFALLALPPTAGTSRRTPASKAGDEYWYHHEKDERRLVLSGYKHTSYTVARLVPSLCAVNGPIAVPAGGMGECTQDWPTRVLHDGRPTADDGQRWLDSLPNGSPCGPVPGHWGVSMYGSGFVCLSHDRMRAVADGSQHLVWIGVDPMPSVPVGFHTNATSSQQVEFGKEIDIASNVDTLGSLRPTLGAQGFVSYRTTAAHRETQPIGITLLKRGLYQVSAVLNARAELPSNTTGLMRVRMIIRSLSRPNVPLYVWHPVQVNPEASASVHRDSLYGREVADTARHLSISTYIWNYDPGDLVVSLLNASAYTDNSVSHGLTLDVTQCNVQFEHKSRRHWQSPYYWWQGDTDYDPSVTDTLPGTQHG